MKFFECFQFLLFDRWELIEIFPVVSVGNLMLIEDLVISPVVLLES